MNKHLLKIMFVIVALVGTIFVTTDSADAQRRGRKIRAANQLSKAQVGQIIKNVEIRVDYFKTQFDKSLDNSRLNGTKREDKLNDRAGDLESATDELRREFDRSDTWAENKNEVKKCVDIASDIDVVMRNRKLGKATESNWKAVRLELNALAKAYGVPGIGGSYR